MISCSILPFVLAAAPGVFAAEATVQVSPVLVEYDAPDGCSGPQAFYGWLRYRTNRVRPADPDEPHTTLQVRLTRQRTHVTGELRMVGDHGGLDTRRVQGSTCDEVVQALSLTAALALDPTALLSPPDGASAIAPSGTGGAATTTPSSSTSGSSTSGRSPSERPAEERAPDKSAPERTPTDRPTERSPDRPPPESKEDEPARNTEAPVDEEPSEPVPVPGLQVSVGAAAFSLLSGSTTPGLTLGLRKIADGEGVWRPSIGLTLAYLRNDVVQSPRIATAKLAAAQATLCPLRFSASILTIEPCAFFTAGWLAVTGRQVTHPATVDRLWLSAGGTLRLSAWLGGGLSVEVEGGFDAVLLKRQLFTTLPSHVVAETPTVSPIVAAAIAYGW